MSGGGRDREIGALGLRLGAPRFSPSSSALAPAAYDRLYLLVVARTTDTDPYSCTPVHAGCTYLPSPLASRNLAAGCYGAIVRCSIR
eukprot:scaffold6967_cov123-Isochrysis_galbana.AAC.9